MAETTHIEWTDATWNVITGCSLKSGGCIRCYAALLAGTRLKNHPLRAGLTKRNAAGEYQFTGEVRFNEQWLDQPLRWKRPRRIFVCAHGDLFHENVPDEWIDRIFAVMSLCQQHTFQVLTKRPARARAYLAQFYYAPPFVCSRSRDQVWPRGRDKNCFLLLERGQPWPLPNVWLGTSVEDQETADERIPELLACPAALHFVSYEPALGPVDWREICAGHYFINALAGIKYHDDPSGLGAIESMARLGWMIMGGESGPGARPMHPDWACRCRDQCAAAGVPFLFKQWGEWLPIRQLLEEHRRHVTGRRLETSILTIDGTRHATAPETQAGDRAYGMLRVGKKRAGRLLDGVVHDGFPDTQKEVT